MPRRKRKTESVVEETVELTEKVVTSLRKPKPEATVKDFKSFAIQSLDTPIYNLPAPELKHFLAWKEQRKEDIRRWPTS